MDTTIIPAVIFLSVIWFAFYWVMGGVFFAAYSLMRLRRIRQVRFSCLFSFWALLVAVVTAQFGIRYSEGQILECLSNSETKTEAVTAVFGCGFMSVLGTFLIGAAMVVIGGLLLMEFTRARNNHWIRMKNKEEEEAELSKERGDTGYFSKDIGKSKNSS